MVGWVGTYAQQILREQRDGDHNLTRLAAFKEAMYLVFAANPFPDGPASLKHVEPKGWAKQRAERYRIKHCHSDLEILLRALACRVPMDQVRAVHAVIYG